MEKRARERLAQELATLVALHAPDEGQWKHPSWPVFSAELMCAVDHISIDRLARYSDNSWTVSAGGFVPEWDVASLQAEIDRKNDKPAHYLTGYRETWLLVVSALGAPSGWMEMPDHVRNAKFRSRFSRIFLLSLFPFTVFELQFHRSQ